MNAQKAYEQADFDTALTLYEKAAQMGYELAQSNAAFIYDMALYSPNFLPNNTNEERYRRAFRYFALARGQMSGWALLKLGDYYYYGLGDLSVNYAKAYECYRYASELRQPQATFNLGYMHEHGLGIPKDFNLAKRYYDLTLETNSETYAPVMLALAFLFCHNAYDHYFLESSTEDLFSSEEFDWGDIAIALVVVFLVVAIIKRRHRR